MKEFIYINENSLSNILCNEIIQLYENESNNYDHRYEGVTRCGMKKNIKDTLDISLQIDTIEEDPTLSHWLPYVKILTTELTNNLLLYKKQIDPENDLYNFDEEYQNIFYTTFLIQRYSNNKGKYIYHTDDSIDVKLKKYRKLTYLWYLNDVQEGGETEFFGNFKVKPTQGKMIIFPAEKFFPHSGLIPISNDKYIATGWIYCDY